MSNQWNPDNIFEVWADGRARQVLIAVAQQPRSVNELTDICDGSSSSIYRRVDVLTNHELLEEDVHVDDNGHHYSVYCIGFESMEIEPKTDEIFISINKKEDSEEKEFVPKLNKDN